MKFRPGQGTGLNALQLAQSAVELGTLNRFEQVVNGIYFKSLQGKLLIRCGKDDQRLRAKLAQNIKAAHFRHLDIEKDYIRTDLLNGCHRLNRIGARACDLNPAGCAEHTRKPLEGERLVVNQKCAHRDSSVALS